MFEAIENSAVAVWVGESLWAYPFWLGLHAIGLAIVVGVFAVRDLKLIGLFDGISITSFLPLTKFAWLGLLVNATSGLFLFTSQATIFVASTPFLTKITLIFAAAILALVIQNKLRAELASGSEAMAGSGSLKLIAMASLALWIGVIVAGRLIAYL
ncbi:MAG: hypothetical protein MI725_12490 [Pirellulales bacterium]|nr:hypothetical protein [Pirellulales bacterium]